MATSSNSFHTKLKFWLIFKIAPIEMSSAIDAKQIPNILRAGCVICQKSMTINRLFRAKNSILNHSGPLFLFNVRSFTFHEIPLKINFLRQSSSEYLLFPFHSESIEIFEKNKISHLNFKYSLQKCKNKALLKKLTA